MWKSVSIPKHTIHSGVRTQIYIADAEVKSILFLLFIQMLFFPPRCLFQLYFSAISFVSAQEWH